MARYIDADKFRQELINRQITTQFFNNRERHEIGCIIDMLDNTTAADVIPTSEVDKARQQGYESGKREIARNIYIKLYNEIIAARDSNYEAIKERETKHNINRYEDTFCHYCDGKIHALDGIFYFITELTEKYMEG